MTTFTEVLPRTQSGAAAIRWTPSGDDLSPVAGVLRIDTERASDNYVVTEFPTGWTNRGFTVTKTVGNRSYTVFCHRDRLAATSCDCEGHRFHFHCKHADAVAALVENGWL